MPCEVRCEVNCEVTLLMTLMQNVNISLYMFDFIKSCGELRSKFWGDIKYAIITKQQYCFTPVLSLWIVRCVVRWVVRWLPLWHECRTSTLMTYMQNIIISLTKVLIITFVMWIVRWIVRRVIKYELHRSRKIVSDINAKHHHFIDESANHDLCEVNCDVNCEASN